MHTECPHCQTLFNVTAAQIRLAHGIVRCGQCMNTFDALEALSDRGFDATREDEPSAPTIEHHGDRQLLRNPMQQTHWKLADADDLMGDDVAPDSPDAEPAAEFEASPESNVASTDAAPIDAVPMRDAKDVADSGGERAQAPPAWPPQSTMLGEDSPQALAPFGHIVPSELPSELDAEPGYPEVLEEDIARLALASRKRRLNSVYGSLSLLLLLGVGVQYLLSMPEDAVKRYPMTRTLVEKICTLRDCEIAPQRDPRLIEVVSRDVRVHPRYEGALQVSASVVNAAGFTQPYPRVQFTLFNVNGQTIAARVFKPEEYLSQPTNIEAGMRPKTQTRIELNVLAPDEAAVSFEFKFL